MYMNEDGINIIKKWEGLEDGNPETVNLDPYLCPADVWTIGWGHAIVHNGMTLNKQNDPKGKIAKSIYPFGITKEQANDLLKKDIDIKIMEIKPYIKDIKLNSNQFSAMVSFSYNVGSYNLIKSTLLRKVKMNDFVSASEEFKKWTRSKGKILNGLIKRREDERKLFLKREKQ